MNHRNPVVSYRRPAGPVVSYSCPLNGSAPVAGGTQSAADRAGGHGALDKRRDAAPFTTFTRRS